MRTLPLFLATSLALVAFTACSSSTTRGEFDDDADDGSSGSAATTSSGGASDGGGLGQVDAAPPAEPGRCEKMDLVFVVDDSGSMGEEQDNLADNFPGFIDTLNEFVTDSGSKLDWRIAVTTTGRDVNYKVEVPQLPGLPPIPPQSFSEDGDNGVFRDESCGADRRWIERDDPSPEDDFSCRAKVGTSGPGLEMPLETLRLALTDRVADGTNDGFLRPDALLAVVILTDEDDGSRTDDNFTISATEDSYEGEPVESYAASLNTIAKGEGRWAAAVIAGETSCESSFGKAVEAKRLKQLVELAGARGKFSSICSGNLTSSLAEALATFDAACSEFPPPSVN